MLKNKKNEYANGEMTGKEGAEVRRGRTRRIRRHGATRVLALILALAMVLTSADFGALGKAIGGPVGSFISSLFQGSGPSKVKAISGSEWGNYLTFAEKLPATEVHIDRSKMTAPTTVEYLNNSIQNVNGVISVTEQMYSNRVDPTEANPNAPGPMTYSGDLVRFTFKDAAILSTRERADVVITLRNVEIHTVIHSVAVYVVNCNLGANRFARVLLVGNS